MRMRQFRNCVIIFIVFFFGTLLGVRDELIKITIMAIVSIPLGYFAIMLVMIMYSQIDYDEIIEIYNYFNKLNEKKLKIQICSEKDLEILEEYNEQIQTLGYKIISNSKRYFKNKNYRRFIPKELYEMRKEKIEIIVEKTKKIINKT